jgi:hypothetical protein
VIRARSSERAVSGRIRVLPRQSQSRGQDRTVVLVLKSGQSPSSFLYRSTSFNSFPLDVSFLPTGSFRYPGFHAPRQADIARQKGEQKTKPAVRRALAKDRLKTAVT